MSTFRASFTTGTGSYEDIQKKNMILKRKVESHTRLQSRIMETNHLQLESNQRLNLWDNEEKILDDLISQEKQLKREVLSKKGLKIRKRDGNFAVWNDYTLIPKKTVDIIANEKILEKDENAVKLIQDFIKKKRLNEQTRSTFLNLNRLREIAKLNSKHNKTLDLEQRIGIHKNELNKSGDLHTRFANFEEKKEFYQRDYPKKELFEKLANPSYKSLNPRSCNPYDNTLFRGLLISDIDEIIATQTKNEYVKAVIKSPLFQENLDFVKSSRPQSSALRTSTQRPKTARSEFNMKYEFMPEHKLRELEILTSTFSDFSHEKIFDDENEIRKEMEEFNYKIKLHRKVHRRVGYPQIAFNEAIDFSTTEGYKNRKAKMKEKNNNNLM